MQKLISAVAFLWTLLWSFTAAGHDFWIQPSSYQPEPGQKVDLTLWIGGDFAGEDLPRIDGWFSRFEQHDEHGQNPVPGQMGDDPAGSITAGTNPTLVIYRSEQEFTELHSGKFESYLKDEGLDWVIDYRKQHKQENDWGRELFSRCAKTLIRPAGAHDSQLYKKNTGMPLEILPQEDPYALDKSGYLPVLVLYNNQPLPGIQVVAYSASNPEEKRIEHTDQNGIATFHLTHSDQWLIKAVHMIHAKQPNEDNAHWESFWGSYTFETDIQ